MNFEITGRPLDPETIEKIVESRMKLSLSEESRQLVVRCREYLDRKLGTDTAPIYGITTGFGALHNIQISRDQLNKLQENLVISHACGTGDEVCEDIVRTMLLLKIHALSYGKSGVQAETVERLIDFFNESVTPVVYEQGSLGASGDLAPLAHLVLPLIGMGEARIGDAKSSAAGILRKFGWKPVILRSKEGLALLNGTQFMSAHGVYIIQRAQRLSQAADIIAAISLDAYDGRIDPFLRIVHEIRPHKGQIETSEAFLSLLEGSSLISKHKDHVQDPYSFRCIPQVHGATKDAIRHARSVIVTEINSVTDNPTIFPDEDLIISGGNFHGQPLALVFDFLAIALAELGSISERRIYRLISGERGLPEFLVASPGLNSGFMIPQYTAASVVSQNKQLCTPASVDSIPSSNEQEDHVSMGANGATRLLRVVANIEKILAIELFTAVQALEFRRPGKSSAVLEKVVAAYRSVVPFIDDDRIMYPEIARSIEFVRKINRIL
ncbi:MAG: histidine ammonia-lyase [Bacteroidales bacterium]|jgi:histidine ammonia-lyase|nr:histidine ammonia-lyase [Bacteroidales bacterium]MCU0407597.1 histidine ammonia-lyase [Bacteroidales bacterium]